VFVVPDAAADPRFATHALVNDGPRSTHFRFYAGASLLSPTAS
jgi:GAF domain-containing protein